MKLPGQVEGPEYAALVHQGLKAADVSHGVYVPDIILDPIISILLSDPDFHLTRVAREEEGVGVVGGHHIGGKRSVLILQSSGLGNSANALATFSVPYQIGFLILLSPRGTSGEINPAQMAGGRSSRAICDALGFPWVDLDNADAVSWAVADAGRTAFRANVPVVLSLTRRLTGGKDE